MADTVKVQWQAYPGPGSLLLSDMGRVLAYGRRRHERLPRHVLRHVQPASTTSAATATARPTGPRPSGRDRLLVALAKHGLTDRDIAPDHQPVHRACVEADGVRDAAPGRSPAGAQVVLRAEMRPDRHRGGGPPPRSTRGPTYSAGPVRVTAWRGAPAGPDDPLRTASPEARRAYENTDEELRALGLPA